MYKKLILALMLLLSHILPPEIWALSRSTPTTVSDPRYDAHNSSVSANEKGDAAVTWTSSRGKKEAVTLCYKRQNSVWSTAEIISDWNRSIDDARCLVNAEGDLFAVWEADINDESFISIAEKKQGGPWGFF